MIKTDKKNLKRLSVIVATSLYSVFGLVASVSAAAGGSSGDVSIPEPLGSITPAILIGRVINGFLGITGVIALVIFVYAGFIMMTAQGNSTKVEQSKKTMFWAAVGLMGVFASYSAVSFVIKSIGA